MIYITSDIHLNDKNIMKYQQDRFNKYFKVDIMNREIIHYQNSVITDDDIIYVIGDFIVGNSKKEVFNLLNKLNGKIYLIIGNHDSILSNYDNIDDRVFIIKNIHKLIYKTFEFYMFHYPLLEQPNFYNYNSFHLFGHLHGKMKHISNRAMDVSFNIYDFKFLTIREVINIFKNELILKG